MSVFYLYDEQMLLHRDHNFPPTYRFEAPEFPHRIEAIYEYLTKKDLLPEKLERKEFPESWILKVHTGELLQKIKGTEELGPNETTYTIHSDNYESQGTWKTVKCAVDCCLTGVEHILDHGSRGYAIVRPPGHHAHSNLAYGFCFLNNVAIAAKYALETGKAKKVLVFDWDIHHGDGLQTIFYSDPNVLVMSLHRCDNYTFWPQRKDAGPENVGEGAGQGFHCNVAWNTGHIADELCFENNQQTDLGNNEYMFACEEVLLPIAKEFQPDLIIISNGFDAAIHDPLGWSKVSPMMYYWMTKELVKVQSKVLACQEGGYNPDFLGQHASGVMKALQNLPYGEPEQADLDAGFSSMEQICKSAAV
jgi:histone deacetylase 6